MNILILGPSNYFVSRARGRDFESNSRIGQTAVDASVRILLTKLPGSRITLLTLSQSQERVEVFSETNFEIIVVPERKSHRSKIFDLYGAERKLIRSAISRDDYDFVLVHWIYEYALAIPKSLISRVTLIFHDTPIRVMYLAPSMMRIAKMVMAYMVRIKLRKAKFAFVSNHTWRNAQLELLFRRNPIILPNPIVPIKLGDHTKKIPLSILYIGSISKLKDPHALILASETLTSLLPGIRIRFVGPGLEPYGELSWKTKRTDSIEFLGVKPTNEIYDLIKESYLVVSCSKEESFGLTCLESLYLGTKFLSRHPLPSFMDIGLSNPLFIPSSPSNFTLDISRHLCAAYSPSEIELSRRLIEEKFGPDKYVSQLLVALNGSG
jgi:glycosyltransferase involved in cell wall biosynthesis